MTQSAPSAGARAWRESDPHASAQRDSGGELAAQVQGARAGDEAAARALFERFQDALMGYCILACDGRREAAKDLSQEIFGTVFQKLDQLEEPANFSAWLWTIARRTCASRGNRRSRYADILDLFSLERQVVLAADDKASRERRIRCVQRLLEDIDDPTMRRIAQLKYTDPEHTTREIAAKLEMPHGTVTVKLMRFRERIAGRVADKLDSIDDRGATKKLFE